MKKKCDINTCDAIKEINRFVTETDKREIKDWKNIAGRLIVYAGKNPNSPSC
jgi:hypothetical protein